MTNILKINFWSVLIVTVAAFIVSSIYYIIFNHLLMKLHGIAPTNTRQNISVVTMLLELGRTLVLAFVLAYFVNALHITQWKGALKLTFIIWLGFPFILLTGSILHENFPWRIAIIHAGDWFIKPLIMILILSWRNH